MSQWTHSICDLCWFAKNACMPTRTKEGQQEKELCCFCNMEHSSGIYLRADPIEVGCQGKGPVHTNG